MTRQPYFGLLRPRPVPLPTWKGWLLAAAIVALVAVIGARQTYPFLAQTNRLPSKVLVVEGWVVDYILADAIAEFHRHRYDKMYVTGGPIEKGEPLSEHKTHADLAKAILLRMGMAPDKVEAVPAPRVRQDRTFASAVALKKWLERHSGAPADFNVMSPGPHSRRSRILYEKAFGAGTKVGVISGKSQEYNSRLWWTSSAGFREVTAEIIAYVYTRFFHSFAEDELEEEPRS